MKRVILLFAAVLLATVGWSQTVTLKFKNGTTQQFNMSDLVSIDFTQGDNNNGNDPMSGDYIQIVFKGKTYTDATPYYAQILPVGVDSQNRKLTFTYDIIPHFEELGFCFMIGLVHFTHESDLLACSTGTYGCARDIIADDFYRNLTLTTLLDIDYDEYNWVGGTHEVKSIQKVNGKIQIEGSFTSNFELKGDSQFISGSYRMTIP